MYMNVSFKNNFLCTILKLHNLLKCHFSLHKRWISFMWFWSVYCIQHPIIDVTSIIYKDIENVIKASDFFWGQKNNSLLLIHIPFTVQKSSFELTVMFVGMSDPKYPLTLLYLCTSQALEWLDPKIIQQRLVLTYFCN